MRFIGSKDLINSEIFKVFEKKNLLNKNLTLFDAFCGTGAVSDNLKNNFNLILNDSIFWSVIYSYGRVVSNKCNFKNLKFDPFQFLNNSKKTVKGFFYKNYSPGGSNRMYFTKDNAARIDYFRQTIEEWKIKNKINKDEYYYLLYCLIESISLVSNTAGVYGAFLKHWDQRAKKKINFIKISSKIKNYKKIKTFNDRIENVIKKINCDVLYLDPPYTQNQYGTQYHILQTLVLNDNPSVSKITGSRPVTPMRSDWSINYKCHILFNKIISETKAKHIVFSYSSDGLMSKKFIEASLKRYAKKDTYSCEKIYYKKYQNFKTKKSKSHFEYIFYIEKKNKDEVFYESPLNYIGSKYRALNEISKYLPKKINTFVDLFGGGFNVGINISAKSIVYNDINYLVTDLIKFLKFNDTYQFILKVKQLIKRYNLKPQSKEGYIKLRSLYNSKSLKERQPLMLFTLVLYGFNQQIRFNSNYLFNNPIGMRWFNDLVLEKLISFSNILKEKNIIFFSKDFLELEKFLKKNYFIYMDPPYYLTTSSYNDGRRGFKGWNETLENQFLKFVSKLDNNKFKFMISYLLDHKGKTNKNIINWIKKNKFRLVNLNIKTAVKRKESLIINY